MQQGSGFARGVIPVSVVSCCHHIAAKLVPPLCFPPEHQRLTVPSSGKSARTPRIAHGRVFASVFSTYVK